MNTKTNLADRFGNGASPLSASQRFNINKFMISDAGCDAFNKLTVERLTDDSSNWFLYATSEGTYNKSKGFKPENVCYTGDINPQLGGGAGQNLTNGAKLALAAWKYGNLKTLATEIDENSQVTHSFGFAGGGSTFPAILKLTKELKEATQTSSPLSNDDEFSLEDLVSSSKKYGLLATIVAPRSGEQKKWENYKQGINSFLYQDGGYDPIIGYQVLKIDDIIAQSSTGELSDQEILRLSALHFAKTNMIIKRFYTSESISNTDIDSSEILGALAEPGEVVINLASSGSMEAKVDKAFTAFKREYKRLNAASTIEGASSALVLFEYPTSYNREIEDIKAEEAVITMINDQCNTDESSAIIKYACVNGDVTYPTINCIFTGINAEARRTDLSVKKNNIGLSNVAEQLRKNNAVIDGGVSQNLSKSEAASLRWANKRDQTDSTRPNDENLIRKNS